MTDRLRTDGWQLDDAGAANYERFLVAAVLDAWARDLVDAAELVAGARVLDVACGTGIVTRTAADRVGPRGELAGVDRNTAMLAVARKVARETQPAIAWKEADAADLPFADASFDVVLCQQGLQFFRDPAAALAEMHRVLVPGGRLGLSTCRDLTHQPGYTALTGTLRRHLAAEAVDVISSVYTLGDLGDLGRLIAVAGFRAIHRRIELTTFRLPSAEALLTAETASSPLGPITEQVDGAAYAALVDDLTAALAAHTDDDGVVFPFETVVVTARR